MSDNRRLQRELAMARAKWRDKPAGTPVRYWTGLREGEGKTSVTMSELMVLGGHTPGVYVQGAGFIAATHADPIEES